jgi:Holliday junction resolvase-like predicted endonuclease
LTSLYGAPIEAVTPAKQRKIMTAAQEFLQNFNENLYPQFDIIEVFVNKKDKDFYVKKINHLKNVIFNINPQNENEFCDF